MRDGPPPPIPGPSTPSGSGSQPPPPAPALPADGPPSPGPPPAVPGPPGAPPPPPDTTFDPTAAPADAPQGEQSKAIRHATEQSRTYPCAACGGELHFDITTQRLKCQHCGASHELVESTGEVRERDLREALGLVRSGKVQRTASFLDNEKEIVCQNCGGHTTFTGSLTANMCPYCATPIQRDDVHAAPDRLPVDAVLPFRIDRKDADGLINKWINGRWFAPSEFKTYNQTGSFQSVYMAYFTYDADTSTSYHGQRGITRTRTTGHGDNRRTETYTEWYPASGVVGNEFDDVTVLANTGFEKNRIDKLEPWPTGDAQPYSAEYAAGHLARTYDTDVEECLDEAKSRMESEIRSTVKRDIGGDDQRISNMDISWRTMSYKHILLPLWLLTVIYDQRPFQVYMNGVTGEIHGARPYSKVKIIAAAVLALLLVIIVVIAIQAAGGGSG